MAKKNKNAVKPAREYTRRQLSQWQRQRRRERIIRTAGITIIAAVIVIVAASWFWFEYRPMHEVLIRVNDTEFDMAYYIDALAVTAQGQEVDTVRAQTVSAQTGIERAELIRQAAAKLGITASDDDAIEFLSDKDVAVNDATIDMAREQVLMERLEEQYISGQVPETMPQVHLMAMILESQSQVDEVRELLQNSGNFTELADAYSLHYYNDAYHGDFDWRPQIMFELVLGSSVPVDYAFSANAGDLSGALYDEETSKQVGYWLARVLEMEEDGEDAQVQALLLGSREEALEIKARLEAGDNLTALAEEYSQFEESRDQGGDLGIVSRDEVTAALDEYIFSENTTLNTWSEPIRDVGVWTQGAYWLVKVVDRDDNRQLDDDDRSYLVAKALDEWIEALWEDPDYVIDDSALDDDHYAWVSERVSNM